MPFDGKVQVQTASKLRSRLIETGGDARFEKWNISSFPGPFVIVAIATHLVL